MDFNETLNQLNLKSEVVAYAIVALAVLLILLVNRRRLLLRFQEWRIERCLKQIGIEQIRNLVCADGIDGFYSIDRLALTGDAVLLISYKPYDGNIYCAERISEWTQIIGKKSYKFTNPLFELENQLTSLRILIGNAPLRGFLFFNHSALFPKGHPDSVLNPENIPDKFLTANCGTPSVEIRAVWERLKTHQKEAGANPSIGVKT
ncbi:MAG: NERD domain-containing protein [Gammaproteobacteria bacterium]|nr:NERD domain-containing protein [Gammaproteobacteria bacterium]MDH3536574.1 NERD domain-containing protein [Gammaproteobacteria bacterium]